MNYFISETDKNGFIYSIDNLVLEYTLMHPSIDVVSFLQSLMEKYPDYKKEYWEELNKPYSSKWQFFNNRIHICNGINIWFGKWFVSIDGDKSTFPILKLEFNPNKHGHKSILFDIMEFIYKNMGDSELKKYDIAIDVKCKPEDVINIGSRKEKGLYKGTRYYGQRNKDGFCKIYNKKVEQDLDEDLTRIEHTIIHNKKGSNKKSGINLEKIYIRSDLKEDTILKSKPMTAIYRFCVLADVSGLDYEDILNDLGYREQRIIREALNGSRYEKLEYDMDIIKRLIDIVYDLYHINKLHKSDEENENGFMEVGECDLPFD